MEMTIKALPNCRKNQIFMLISGEVLRRIQDGGPLDKTSMDKISTGQNVSRD